MNYLLGIDAGTTALKVVLFDEEGQRVAAGNSEYDLIMPQTDFVELEAEGYWEACSKSISFVLRASKVEPSLIRALAVSSQGETLIPMNKEGKAIRRAIVWLDNRSKRESEIIKENFEIEDVFKITGQPEVVPTWPATKILWMRRNEPELSRETFKYLMVEDFLTYRLTGIPATEYSVVSSSLLFDIRREQWWDEMLNFLGIGIDQLPELMAPGEFVANIAKTASKETGLSTETIVSTGAFDHAAGAIGAGNVGPGVLTETTGAALALVSTTDEPVYDPKRRVPCHHHGLPRKFFLLSWCQTAGMLLRWFRDKFGQLEMETAKRLGVDAYDLLTLEASRVEPGSEGLLVLPHFMGAGPPEFDPYARGVFFGLKLGHTKAHFVRAILESVAYMLRKNVELIEELGVQVEEIRSLGGAARSPLWNQIKADVTSKKILTLRNEEAASLGVAILAGVAGDVFRSVEEGCAVITSKEEYVPFLENQKVYSTLYRVYSDLYIRLKDLFPDLHDKYTYLRKPMDIAGKD